MGVFDRISELQNVDALEQEAKFRYANDMEFRVTVDYAVRCSIPKFVRDADNRALIDALEEQGVASASMALIFFEKAFKET